MLVIHIIRIICTIVLSLLSYGIVFTQTLSPIKDMHYKELADSILYSNLDSLTVKAYQVAELTPNIFAWSYPYPVIDSLNSANYIKVVEVSYNPITLKGDRYYYKTKRMESNVFSIVFDLNYQVIELPDFNFMKIVSQAFRREYIPKETAEQYVIQYSNPKSRKTHWEQLIYDCESDLLYWEFIRRTGYQNVIEEKNRLNALDGTLISTDTTCYKVGFLKAVFNKIFTNE